MLGIRRPEETWILHSWQLVGIPDDPLEVVRLSRGSWTQSGTRGDLELLPQQLVQLVQLLVVAFGQKVVTVADHCAVLVDGWDVGARWQVEQVGRRRHAIPMSVIHGGPNHLTPHLRSLPGAVHGLTQPPAPSRRAQLTSRMDVDRLVQVGVEESLPDVPNLDLPLVLSRRRSRARCGTA